MNLTDDLFLSVPLLFPSLDHNSLAHKAFLSQVECQRQLRPNLNLTDDLSPSPITCEAPLLIPTR